MIRAHNLVYRLANILLVRGKIADFSRDCVCANDSDGLPSYLICWNAALLGAEPSQAEVDAANDQPIALTLADRVQRQGCEYMGERRVLFEVLFTLSNQVRLLRANINALTPGTYSNNATEGGAAQITRAQLQTWLEGKLP